jgi:hypothetical protein
MKHTAIILIFTILFFSVTSCFRKVEYDEFAKKGRVVVVPVDTTPPPPPPPPPIDTLSSFKINGVTVSIDSAIGSLYTTSSFPPKRIIDVFAFKSAKTVFVMKFDPITGDQVVGFAPNNAQLTYVAGNNFPTDQYDSKSGSFNLSVCDTINRKIKGTFSFIGTNGISDTAIKEGKFYLRRLNIN